MKPQSQILDNLQMFAKIVQDAEVPLDSIILIGGIPRRFVFDDFPTDENQRVDVDFVVKGAAFRQKLVDYVDQKVTPVMQVLPSNRAAFNIDNVRYECFFPYSERFGIDPQCCEVEQIVDSFSLTNINSFYCTLQALLGGEPITNYRNKQQYEFGTGKQVGLSFHKPDFLDRLEGTDGLLEKVRLALRETLQIIQYNLTFADNREGMLFNQFCIEVYEQLLECEGGQYADYCEIMLGDLIIKKKCPKITDAIIATDHQFSRNPLAILAFNIEKTTGGDYLSYGHFRIVKHYEELGKQVDQMFCFSVGHLPSSLNNQDIITFVDNNKQPKLYCAYRDGEAGSYVEVGCHDGEKWQYRYIAVEQTRRIHFYFDKNTIRIFESTFWTSRYTFANAVYQTTLPSNYQVFISPMLKHCELYTVEPSICCERVLFERNGGGIVAFQSFLDYEGAIPLMQILPVGSEQTQVHIYPEMTLLFNCKPDKLHSLEVDVSNKRIKVETTDSQRLIANMQGAMIEGFVPLFLSSVKEGVNLRYDIANAFHHFVLQNPK